MRLDDKALLAQCRVDRLRTGGPGGQQRQKSATGVRLTHLPSGLTVVAGEARSLQENLRRALRRLRLRIAAGCRSPWIEGAPLPPELEQQRTPDGALRVRPENPAFPLILATALDAVASSHDHHRAAGRLGVTPTQLARFLERATRLVGPLSTDLPGPRTTDPRSPA